MSVLNLLLLAAAVDTVLKGISPQAVDEIKCKMRGFVLVEGRFGNKTHFLCLKLLPIGSSSLANDHSALLLEPEADEDLYDEPVGDVPEDESHIKAYPLSQYMMAHGFPMDDPSSGSAEGYIGDDHQFYGVLHIGNKTLHADPYGKDNPHKFFGAFEDANMPTPRQRRHDAQARVAGTAERPNVTPTAPSEHRNQLNLDRRYLPFQIEEPRRIIGTARARICDLLLLADKEFYEKDANYSLNNVVQRMMHSVAQADIIFRNADFNEDGIPDNIGFSVKYILVLTSHETNKRVFGDLLQEHSVDGREYLMKFARVRRLSEVCLGVAFSGHAFNNSTLGLSFTSLGGGLGGAAGGLCDRRAYGRSFNTLAIAHATSVDRERVPQRIAALTLAHEMGHSFGAHHDDNFPNPECRGHLMGSESTSAENSNHYEFSICSKRLIASTLNSISYCFNEEAKPYCGNGIVEQGEACDCGLPSRCIVRDPCCTPRAGGALIFEEGTVHKGGCSVASSAECHPSQGLCCQPNCQFADLSKSGIDCRSQNMKCECNNPKNCRCGLGGRCMKDWSCHAAECALLGLKECSCIRSPGGALGESRMCGTCCLVKRAHGAQCVGAEQAVREFGQKQPVPLEWPGDEFEGPNVTVRLCSGLLGRCRAAALRGWAGGAACVSRGAVGTCAARGVCAGLDHEPRSNLYPHVDVARRVKLHSASRSRSDSPNSLRATDFLVFTCTLFIL